MNLSLFILSSDIALLLLRLILAVVFISSGYKKLKNPKDSAEGMDMSKWTTLLLGTVEVIASIFLILGIFIQLSSLLLIGVMLGAIYKKIFSWDVGFYSREGYGWHYDLLLLICNLVIFSTQGGIFTLFTLPIS